MLNLGPFMSFLLISYIGNNENPPITDEIGWSLDVRYCGASLYFFHLSNMNDLFSIKIHPRDFLVSG